MAELERRTNNRRTGLVLASIALAFFIGIMVKYVLLK
jgi:hypothetical protein